VDLPLQKYGEKETGGHSDFLLQENLEGETQVVQTGGGVKKLWLSQQKRGGGRFLHNKEEKKTEKGTFLGQRQWVGWPSKTKGKIT